VTLTLEAMAREDQAEVDRLGTSCPRKTYEQCDIAFEQRMDLAFDTMAVVCIDLRGLWGKLHILHWAMGVARQMATWHQIHASMAFLDGHGCAQGKRQMDFFGKKRAAHEHAEDAHDEDGEEATELADDEAAKVDDGPERLSELWDGEEMGRRMAAVEDRMQVMTDYVFLALCDAANRLAADLANTWEAFGRFTRTRLGIAPETLLDAWGFPIAADFKDMLKRYEHVKPDPAMVDEYFKLITTMWDKRFGG
jgi:hypothetical protein